MHVLFYRNTFAKTRIVVTFCPSSLSKTKLPLNLLYTRSTNTKSLIQRRIKSYSRLPAFYFYI